MSVPPKTEDFGFVQAHCPSCGNQDVWLRCNACGRSDHFDFGPNGVRCVCGAEYDHAICTCGAKVTGNNLHSVPFDKGPFALATTEIAWARIAVALVAVAILSGALVWYF